MATVKITDLPYITSLQSNTANTVLVGVDIPGNFTGQMTLTTLAGGLYSNNFLSVGNNVILLANAVGQFTGNANPYLQVSLHNNDANGSGDFVVTADAGTDTTHYVDVGIQGSNLSQGVLLPLDSYLISVGDTSTTPGGNLIIGTDTINRNIDIVLGGHETNNVVAQFLYGQGFKLTQKPIIFADGTTQNTAVLYSGVDSRVSSNVATINGSITSNIATANLFTQAAFNKANNALANTSGTFAGNLAVTGDLSLLNGSLSSAGNMTVNGTMVLANSNFSPTESALTITASPSVATPANDGYMIHISGKNGVPSRIVTDSYGTGAYAVYAGRAARGTVTSPTAVQTNDVIARFSSSGYGTTKYQTLGVGRIDFVASENFTDANTGSRIEFWNCPMGSNTLNKIATFNGESAVFTGVVSPQKGFIYTPNVQSTLASASVDFSRDCLLKFDVNNNMAISLSNYVAGKVVEVWITNSSGTNKTITHGCLANNSTSKATTFVIQGLGCAYLKYFSIDGDNANTFVSIVA